MTRKYDFSQSAGVSQIAFAVALIVAGSAPAMAQNDFFGTTLPGASQTGAPLNGIGGAAPPAAEPNPYADAANPNAAGEYTDDEKRMQKKYHAKVKHAQGLISRGEKMMKGNKESKEYKKGKILKSIGERELAELKANNPLKDLTAPPEDGLKVKESSGEESATQ
ncbi:MAG: hypothetical protein KC777_07745 [Cyanobacteria bacterium HKST-UBA02]|nr:hypothetical protein [Cyanobacteria bacterium HKST-UBA02]